MFKIPRRTFKLNYYTKVTIMWRSFAMSIIKKGCIITDQFHILIDELRQWFHIRSQDNPADSLSRGELPKELIKNNLWFYGPQWICKNKEV